MDDSEAEADLLEDRDPEEYPSVLRITSESEKTHRQDVLNRLKRREGDKDVPHVMNVQSPDDLRELLTDRSIELLRSTEYSTLS